ncbi:MAG: tetratricopeptide repeat protein [Promethearchaeota archaeon]
MVAEKSTFQENIETFHSRMQQIEFEGYTFLVGPQIPQISPSNLPSPQNMLEDLLQFYIPLSIIPQLKKIPQLTLHLFTQLLIEYVDPDGRFLDYFTIGHPPNSVHNFLADQLGSGEFLCTTTYDYLLEEATKNRVHDLSTIHPVITQADYADFREPSEINTEKFHPIYKLRGSQMNIINGDKTVDSVGSQFTSHIHPFSNRNRSGLSNYKKEIFNKLIKDKVLILTGFDDHDVHEILDILNDISTIPAILWIQHSSNLDFIEISDLKEKEHTADQTYQSDHLDYSDQVESKTLVMGEFLQQFQQNTHCEVLHLKCDLNTVNLGEILASSKRKSLINTSNFSELSLNPTSPSITIPFSEWINQVDPPMEYQKYKLAAHLFEFFGDFSNALSCAKEGFFWEKSTENPMFRALRKANFANMIGIFYRLLEDLESALDYLNQALQFTQHVDNLNSEGIILNSIGLLLMEQGNYSKAGEIFNKALVISEKTGNLANKSAVLTHLAQLSQDREQYDQALENLREVYAIDIKIENIPGQAVDLSNMGVVHELMGNYKDALQCIGEALDIDLELGDLVSAISRINNIGAIYADLEDYSSAQEYYEKAIELAEKLHILSLKIVSKNNLGLLYHSQGKYKKAIELFQECLLLDGITQDQSNKSIHLNNIGLVYESLGQYSEAIEYFMESNCIDQEIERFEGVATSYRNVALAYYHQEDYNLAIKYLEQAIEHLKHHKLYEHLPAFEKELASIRDEMSVKD